MKSTRPVAVITGAARGIGKGCALELARGGFNLLINDLPDADSVEKLHITQQECIAEGVEVICFPADVGDLSLLRHSVSVYWHSRNRKRNCRTARLFSSVPSTPSCWR